MPQGRQAPVDTAKVHDALTSNPASALVPTVGAVLLNAVKMGA